MVSLWENHGGLNATILDVKTLMIPDSSDQLLMYAAALFALMPTLDMCHCYFYSHHRDALSTPLRLQRDSPELLEYIAKINATTTAILKQEFPARLGPSCYDCDYVTTCPAVKAIKELDVITTESELIEAMQQQCALDAKQKRLETIVKSYLALHEYNEGEIGGFKINAITSQYYTFKPKKK